MGKNNFAGNHSWAVGQNVIAGDTSYGHSIAWGYNANAQREYNMAVGLDGTPCTTGLDRYEFKICGDLKVEDVLGTTEGNIQTKSITCTGICTTSSGSKFKIPHPDSSKPKGTSLKHSSIEVPTAGDNLYRWTIDIKNGTAVIQLPDYYKFLNKDDMVWVAAVDNFGRGYGEVDDKQEILTVKADLDGRYNVVLIGTRKDEAAKKYWQGPEEYVEPDK
jgi:hypothetical protein